MNKIARFASATLWTLREVAVESFKYIFTRNFTLFDVWVMMYIAWEKLSIVEWKLWTVIFLAALVGFVGEQTAKKK